MVCLLTAESKASPTNSPLIHYDDSHSPSIPFVKHNYCTDITVVADSSSHPGAPSYPDPWSLIGIQKPYASGILPNAVTLHAKRMSKLNELQNSEASIAEFHGLHQAYLAVLNATAFLMRDRQYRQLKQQQQHLSHETSMIASDDVRRVVQHLERDRDTFSKEAARMESWGAFLHDDLQASKSRIKELEGHLRLAEEHARCAPSWFGAWAEFVQLHCVHGDDKKVGSTELHEAFLKLMRSSFPHIEAPAHKAFRELLQHLGYEYDQVYVDGTNKRGFRGITLLKPTAQLQLKHEFV